MPTSDPTTTMPTLDPTMAPTQTPEEKEVEKTVTVIFIVLGIVVIFLLMLYGDYFFAKREREEERERLAQEAITLSTVAGPAGTEETQKEDATAEYKEEETPE